MPLYKLYVGVPVDCNGTWHVTRACPRGAKFLLLTAFALALPPELCVRFLGNFKPPTCETLGGLPEESNIISMAKGTIGLPGQIIAWISYLLLLYALLCAYIAGASAVLHLLFTKMHSNLKCSSTVNKQFLIQRLIELEKCT